MSELVEFIRARLDEDRAWADSPECTEDPARVLREVEAKRRIIERYEKQAAKQYENAAEEDRTWTLEPVLYDLALPYADHDDYRKEWGPDGS